MRVQAHHFVNDQEVTVQLQGQGTNWSVSGNVTRDEARELPVGAIVTLTVEAAEEE